MMNYQGRIREIQSAFVMGYHDRETCIKMFEELLHDYKLLPEAETLDRTITNENFLALLKAAKDHRDLPTQALPQPPVPPTAIEALQKVNEILGGQPAYRISDSITRRCPVCEKVVPAL